MPVRKIPKNYRNITGMAAHSKSVGCAAYESSLERDFLSLLEFCPDVIRFEVQPVSIEWFDDSGKKHMYTPDILVHYKPSRQPVTIILYEVKYRSDLRKNWSVLQPKFKAARAFCRQKGWSSKWSLKLKFIQSIFKTCDFCCPICGMPLCMNITSHI
jgi:tRNA-I(6)A37 modification enzyme miaB